MRRIRLYCQATLAEGAQIALDEGQGRHLLGVLRLAAGDRIAVFNDSDGEWDAVLTLTGKRGAGIVVERQARHPAPTLGPALLFAPLKRQATDWIIEKATELGVSLIQPVLTRRTVAETVRLDRWRAIAHDAAAQCDRLDAPVLKDPIPLDQVFAQSLAQSLVQSLVQSQGPAQGSATILFADEAGDATPLALAAQRAWPSGAPALLIGPEGGFDDRERTALRAAPRVVPCSLGPLILRAETACLTGLAVVQAMRHLRPESA